jgi:hypothetical protein
MSRRAAAGIADDEDRPIDRLLAMPREEDVVQPKRRRRNNLSHL